MKIARNLPGKAILGTDGDLFVCAEMTHDSEVATMVAAAKGDGIVAKPPVTVNLQQLAAFAAE